MTVFEAQGERFLVREILPTDKPLLNEGLHRLSDRTVYQRFLSPKPNFSSAELRYLTEVDGHDHVAYAVLPLDDGPQRIVAVGRYVRLPEDPDTAEFAVVVADPLQGRGIGGMLGRRLGVTARANGIRNFSATVLEENVAVKGLIRAITTTLEADHHGPTVDLVGPIAA